MKSSVEQTSHTERGGRHHSAGSPTATDPASANVAEHMTSNPPNSPDGAPPSANRSPRTAAEEQLRLEESEQIAHDVLATLRSAQVDTTSSRGDLGPTTGAHTAFNLALAAVVALWAFFLGTTQQLGTTGFVADTGFMSLGAYLTAAGIIVLIARAAGPIGASRAMRSWLLSTPADRSILVRGSVWTVSAGCGAIGSTAAAFAAAVNSQNDLRILTGALLGFTGGALLVTVLAATQHHPTSESVTLTVGVALLSVASLTLTLSVLPGWTTVSQLEAPSPFWLALGPWLDLGVAALCALLTWRLEGSVRRAARLLTSNDLSRGGDVVDALSVSTLMLDSTPLQTAIRPRVRRRIDPLPIKRRGVLALAEIDLRRIHRYGLGNLAVLTAIPLPATVSALFGATGGWWATLLVSYVIAQNYAGGLATYTGSTSLRRDLPFPLPKARLALLLGPISVAGMYAVPALLLARVDLLTWPILVLAVAAGVLRWARPRNTAAAASGMVSTPMGVLPLGLLGLLVRGYDMLLLPGLSVALGLPSVGFLTAAVPFVLYLMRRD